jgi:Skp family chaperone for outer membrane proteins
MHRNTLAFFALFFLLFTTAFDSTAQKLQIKSVSNKQYTPNHKDELVLSATSKKLFTDFNKLELLEEYILDKKNTIPNSIANNVIIMTKKEDTTVHSTTMVQACCNLKPKYIGIIIATKTK